MARRGSRRDRAVDHERVEAAHETHGTGSAGDEVDRTATPQVGPTPPSQQQHEMPTTTEQPRWLEWLATPSGSAVLTLTAVLVSVASLLTSTSITRIGILGPIAFALLLWLALRQGRKIIAVGTALALLFSLALMVRAFSAPGTVSFFYGGQTMGYGGILADQASAPLTADPAQGNIVASIAALPSDAGPIEVSCTREGRFNDGKKSGHLLWARIVGGNFQTLWVPWSFLNALAPGTANALLPCSDWRWRLQHWGTDKG
jgi:hypothetical protein